MALAAAAADGEDADAAARLLGGGEALLERAEATLEPAEQGLRARTLSTLRERIGEAGLEEARMRGRDLTADEAVDLALETTRRI